MNEICPTSDHLEQFVAGCLDEPQHDQVDDHLDRCVDCQTRVDRLDHITLLDSLPQSATPLDGELQRLIERAKSLGLGLAKGVENAALSPEVEVWRTGERVGEYEILRLLGAGGMGQVYLAMHQRMQRKVAIKLMAPQWASMPGARDRFQRETETAAKLSHPNIVSAFDAGQHGEQCFLVMEFVDGTTLNEVVRQGPLSESEAIRCGLDAARGLAFAHQAGIVHRDVKPSNIIRAHGPKDGGTVKVLDLGLVRAMDSANVDSPSLTQSHHCMGTADYLAPEQAIDSRKADGKSDVYSLGCALFHLLAGCKPFAGETPMEVMVAHREQPIPVLDGCSEPLSSLVRAMMAKHPESRPTMSEVVVGLESCEVSHDGAASTRSTSAITRNMMTWPVAVAVVLSIVLSVVLGIVYGLRDPAGVGVAINRTDSGEINSNASPAEATDPPPEAFDPPVIVMVPIEPGKFQMGSATDQPNAAIDEQLHMVELTQPFLIGKFEVTEGQWRKVMGERQSNLDAIEKTAKSADKIGNQDDLPVEGIRWLEAIQFCNVLSVQSGLQPFYAIHDQEVRIAGGDGYRLPTEAEWEYACRAGAVSTWSFGDDAMQLGEHAWHAGNTKHREAVGTKKPNAWGIHDMHGNVSEWCWDRYDADYYLKSPVFDPVGSGDGTSRVRRGGAWYDRATQTRSASRASMQMAYGRYQPVGLRVARTVGT